MQELDDLIEVMRRKGFSEAEINKAIRFAYLVAWMLYGFRPQNN